MNMRSYFSRGLWFLIFFALFFYSCTEKRDPRIPDDSALDIPELEIKRYGKTLFNIPVSNLKEGLAGIQDDYRFFLNGDLEDSLNILRIRQFVTDPFLKQIASAVNEKYPDLESLEDSMALMLAHYHHHFPDAKIPVVYTYISGLHYEQPVRLADSVLIIGLDMFLGEDSDFYPQVGMPVFLAARCTPKHILPACAAELSYLYNAASNEEDLISQMVVQGKRLYFESLLMPWKDKGTLLNYTSGQYAWCKTNEVELWAFLVDNELIFSNELTIINKLMQDGPFTNSFGKESAPRLGDFVGMRIIESYMQRHPDVTLRQLMRDQDAHAIFNKAAYKPR